MKSLCCPEQDVRSYSERVSTPVPEPIPEPIDERDTCVCTFARHAVSVNVRNGDVSHHPFHENPCSMFYQRPNVADGAPATDGTPAIHKPEVITRPKTL